MKRHRIRRVRSVRISSEWVDHLFGISMIGGDQGDTARRTYTLRDPTKTRIDVLASLDSLIQFSRMAHHVGTRKIDDENICLSFVNTAEHFVSHFERRHLRLQIVS